MGGIKSGPDRLRQQIEFVETLDGLKNIFRRSLIMDESRRENSAEHSWHIATAAMIFSEYATREIDLCRVIRMLLVHDVIEIEAGDTFCYDTARNAVKAEKELAAAERLFGLLPADQAGELRDLWEEFEAGATPEAGFANALDRIQPLLQNKNTRGGTWRLHDIESSQVVERMLPVKTHLPDLWPLVLEIIEQGCLDGYLRRSSHCPHALKQN